MHDETDRLIGLFYEAAASPTLWGGALAAFARAAQASDAHIIALDKDSARPIFAIGSRSFGAEFFPDYFRQWASRDPLIPKMIEAPKAPGALMLSHEYLSTREVARNDYFQEFAIPRGLRYQAAWVLEDSSALHAVVDLHHAKVLFDRDSLTRWTCLVPHLQRALRLGLQLAGLRAEGARLRYAIDQAQLLYLVADSASRLLDQSAGAAKLLRGSDPLRVNRGRLVASAAHDTYRLHSLIAAAAKGRGGGDMHLSSDPGSAWRLQIVPAGVSSDNPFSPMHADCAMIFIHKCDQRTPPGAAAVRAHLQCTVAEAQVAALLAAGRSPPRIAALRRVSINTVRTQIRALFACTGATRIGELVAILARL